ncbi:hypothetical protein GGX14DRAFT_61017 [Mycena pura]|uniref:Uncharacterized protein n=1 Tax=Mycena pura TaxID=153505 RepID=A0AAD6VN72_9AGAR|nr:hypothetical protein GGX14DRAFT_61017 [Mycena pura]
MWTTDNVPGSARSAPSPERTTIFRTALRHLFCFSSLTSADLTTTGGFDLDDALLVELARAWPNIKEFDLRAELMSSAGCRVTLSGLCVLARLCPALVVAGVELTTFTIPSLASVLGGGQQSAPALSELRVGYSPILDPFLVAGFLSATFPKITKVFAAYLDGFEIDDPTDPERERDALLYYFRWTLVDEELSKTRALSSNKGL